MTKQLHFLAIVLFSMATRAGAAASATPLPIIRITPGDAAKTIDIQLANLQRQSSRVVVQDMEGKIWFSEQIESEDGYAKKLNLQGLPEGRYICFVQNRQLRHTQAFRLNTDALIFFEQSASSNSGTCQLVHSGGIRPCIVRVGTDGPRAIRLQLANLQQQNTVIRLSALGDGIAFEEQVGGQSGYARKINLDGLTPGAYFLYLKTGDAEFIQHFDLDAEGLRMGKQEKIDQPGQPPSVVVKNTKAR